MASKLGQSESSHGRVMRALMRDEYVKGQAEILLNMPENEILLAAQTRSLNTLGSAAILRQRVLRYDLRKYRDELNTPWYEFDEFEQHAAPEWKSLELLQEALKPVAKPRSTGTKPKQTSQMAIKTNTVTAQLGDSSNVLSMHHSQAEKRFILGPEVREHLTNVMHQLSMQTELTQTTLRQNDAPPMIQPHVNSSTVHAGSFHQNAPLNLPEGAAALSTPLQRPGTQIRRSSLMAQYEKNWSLPNKKIRLENSA